MNLLNKIPIIPSKFLSEINEYIIYQNSIEVNINMNQLIKKIEENKESNSLTSVLKTIKMTYETHSKISSQQYDVVLVKVLVKLTPEIKVLLGEPKLHL